MKEKNKIKVIVSGIFIIISLILKKVFNLEIYSNIFLIIASLIAGYSIVINALKGLKYKIIGIDLLVTIAVIGAIYIGEYFEAAAVTFLFTFGNYLEAISLEKTRSHIKSLVDMTPLEARVFKDEKEMMVDIDKVEIDDTVIIRPGEKIPIDGLVSKGSAYVKEAIITGENMAVFKEKNSKVYQGTIIESGFLIVKTKKLSEDTTFSRIIDMVEEAQDKKANTQKFLEKFSSYYTPFIIILSVIVFIITRDIRLSITLLVISCPGALVISTPVSLVSGIGNGAKNGVLIKGGESIEKFSKIDTILFDKTGTLTEGVPEVTKVKGFNFSREEVLIIAKELEIYSEHPLRDAIVNKANEIYDSKNKIVNFTEDNINILTGLGIKGTSDQDIYLIGNKRLQINENINLDEDINKYIDLEEKNGQTVVILSKNKEVVGIISISDKIRKESKNIINELRIKGIKKIYMLTGDNKSYAKAVSEELNLDDYYAELLPEDKVDIVKNFQSEGKKVAMVGDGINDAPALATADIGIAVGGAGSEVAMETADIVIMSDNILKLPFAYSLSKAIIKNMKQNIIFAVFIVTMLLFGVLFKVVFLSAGMLIHELSVIMVILNAIRLLGYKEK